jgi:hypothetical protein
LAVAAAPESGLEQPATNERPIRIQTESVAVRTVTSGSVGGDPLLNRIRRSPPGRELAQAATGVTGGRGGRRWSRTSAAGSPRTRIESKVDGTLTVRFSLKARPP